MTQERRSELTRIAKVIQGIKLGTIKKIVILFNKGTKIMIVYLRK